MNDGVWYVSDETSNNGRNESKRYILKFGTQIDIQRGALERVMRLLHKLKVRFSLSKSFSVRRLILLEQEYFPTAVLTN